MLWFIWAFIGLRTVMDCSPLPSAAVQSLVRSISSLVEYTHTEFLVTSVKKKQSKLWTGLLYRWKSISRLVCMNWVICVVFLGLNFTQLQHFIGAACWERLDQVYTWSVPSSISASSLTTTPTGCTVSAELNTKLYFHIFSVQECTPLFKYVHCSWEDR